MTQINKKEKRPPIPNETKLKLWVLAAGRCEFPGCNKFLLHDGLTLVEGNYSNIAHIVSWSPEGPRGDKVRSPLLAKDITNLMLVCQRCGKLIDDKKNISTYPENRLLLFKKNHEERIRIQTDIQENRKTTVVRLQANLRGRDVKVGWDEVRGALVLAGRYPVDEKGIFVDLSGLKYSLDSAYWDTAAKQIKMAIERGLSLGNDELKHLHLSIFGIAPIPLLVYLGFIIGNTINSDIYLKPRHPRNWFLDQSGGERRSAFLIRKPKMIKKSKRVAISLAISGTNNRREILRAVGRKVPVYEITVVSPRIDVLKSASDLELFRIKYREILDEIRERHGKKSVIHLFGAIPSCVAIMCGREILHGVDPSIIIYEYADKKSGFIKALTIN